MKINFTSTGALAMERDPESFNPPNWRAESELVAFVQEQFEKRLENYKSIPYDVRDHHILEHAAASAQPATGRIVFQLSGKHLYAANTGAPLTKDGIIALLSARSSSKRQNQIGRFGIGFKSLLGLRGRLTCLAARCV